MLISNKATETIDQSFILSILKFFKIENIC